MRFLSANVLVAILSVTASARAAEPAATQPASAPATQPASAPAAESAPAPTTQPAKRPLDPPFGLNSRTASGDWFGLRPALREKGIDTQFFYNNHYMAVLKRGKSTVPGAKGGTGGGKNSATIDWITTFDLDKMGLIKDADVLVHVRDGWGYSINPYTGTTRGLDVNDDADGKQDLYIDQLWYRQFFLDHKLALQVGYVDMQTIVDRNAYANIEDRQFMNTALDNNPLLPTAAITTLGAAMYIHPVEWYTLILAAGNAQGPQHGANNPWYEPDFDTTFHGHAWFVGYIEHDLSFKLPGPKGPLPGNYRFGMLYDPRPRPTYRYTWEWPDQQGNEWSFYTSCDQLLFRENSKDEQGLGVFFRYAHRNKAMNRFSDVWSGGVSYTGLIPGRDRDTLGLAFAQLFSSDRFENRINRRAGEETVYEMYYAIAITPWLVISPDIQYVDNPGANTTISHAIVGGVRARMSF